MSTTADTTVDTAVDTTIDTRVDTRVDSPSESLLECKLSLIYTVVRESERARNRLEMCRLQRRLAGKLAEAKNVRQFHNTVADDATLSEYVYPGRASVKRLATDATEAVKAADAASATGDGESMSPPEAIQKGIAALWIDSNDNDKSSVKVESSGKSVSGDGNGDGGANGGTGSVRDTVKGEEFLVTKDNGKYETCFEESTSIQHSYYDDTEAENAVTETAVTSAEATESSQARLACFEAFGVAYTLDKYVDRVRVFEAMDGASTDSDDDDDDDGAGDEAARRQAPRSNKAFVLRALRQAARELKCRGTYNGLCRTVAAMERGIREERELRAECSSNAAKLNELCDERNHEMALYSIKKGRQMLAEQFDQIKNQIEMDAEYIQLRQEYELVEYKELLKVKERRLQKQRQAVDNAVAMRHNCLEEAIRIFSEYTKKLEEHVEWWEHVYSVNLGLMDSEIMTIEFEQTQMDETHAELLEKFAQLQSKIDELEERRRKREESTNIVWI